MNLKLTPNFLCLRSNSRCGPVSVSLALAGLLLSAVSFASNDLDIADIWARESPPTVSNGAVYLIISDRSGSGDRLIGATSDVALKAELHEHRMEHGTGDDKGEAKKHDMHGHDSHKHSAQSGNGHGMMKMRQVDAIDIPANGSVALAPMGYHIMLFDLKAPLKDGESFELTLEFEKSGTTVVDVDVKKPDS